MPMGHGRTYIDRRKIMLALAAAVPGLGAGAIARASEDPVELEWEDLLPEESRGMLVEQLKSLGIVQHGELSTPFDQEAARAVVTEYNGKLVRIPGYAVPLEFKGADVVSFILVPYIGACIHVPPPPANQLVFVTLAEPYDSDSLWDPIYATGMFTSSAVETELAEVGYTMKGAWTAPYYF